MAQTNHYLNHPEMTTISTTILHVRRQNADLLLCPADNIVRPAGGGEPCDEGLIRLRDRTYPFATALKRDGLTWLVLPAEAFEPSVGEAIDLIVDADHRQRRRRSHTGLHIALRSCLDEFGHGIVVSAEVAKDARQAHFEIELERAEAQEKVERIVVRFADVVSHALPIDAIKAKSIDDARAIHGALFRVSDRHAFSGKVRLIRIEGFDVNPCGGLHWPDTGIGVQALRLDIIGGNLRGVVRLA